MKKILPSFSTSVIIFSGIVSLFYIAKFSTNINNTGYKESKLPPGISFATDNNPVQKNENNQSILAKDARLEILENYLKENDSPFANLAGFIIGEADKNNLDFRTIPAIANCESNLGIRIPEKSYNAWGYGVYGDKVLKFENWQDGIRTVSEGLRQNYIEQGLQTPEEVMGKYTPPSIAKGGPWAKCIRETFKQLE